MDKGDVQQAFDYCFGETFIIPPPYVLVSNGSDNRWFRRCRKNEDEYTYSPVDAVAWKKAKQEAGAGEFVEQLSLKRLIKALAQTRTMIFEDLTQTYFPESFKLDDSNLGKQRGGFEKVLITRKSFVDSSLADLEEKKAVQHVLSSIALSLTLKVLFVKVLSERKSDNFPAKVRQAIDRWSSDFPGILRAEPYDVLEFSDQAQDKIANMFYPAGVLQALLFEASDNPIGDIWDGLVESEFDDLQVKSLGNVYTPRPIVNTMVDASERALGGWINKNVLEPACGSGHFVREVYKRIRDAYLNERPAVKGNPIIAHRKALEHLRAIDIDPFAVQTTQLGMFLELYRSTDVWKAVAPNDKFDFSKVVARADFLDAVLFAAYREFRPNLVIGNPPYGVKVTDEIAAHFGLGNDDSYGCFIVRSLEILEKNGQMVFVVSNTFMTTKTHQELREYIYQHAIIEQLLQLHRSAFAGRDVFCCLIQLKRSQVLNCDYFYKYCDAWAIHPYKPEYKIALKKWAAENAEKLSDSLYFEYHSNARLAHLRLNPPPPKSLEPYFETNNFMGMRALGRMQKRPYPIHGGFSSLYLLVSDEAYSPFTEECVVEMPLIGPIEALKIQRSDSCSCNTVKLWQIAKVVTGLQTSDDKTFLRKTPGVVPNARRKYIEDVPLSLTIAQDRLSALSEQDKENGIPVLDKARTQHFVPFDKGGEQDIESGELRSYWSPVDYWIDWSSDAVKELKDRNDGTSKRGKKPRFQNARFYFKSGIRFSPAGIYAPMFELSFGGVPGHKGSIILPVREELIFFLLPILCSPVVRYLTKNFLQHTVMTEADAIKQIPIPVPEQKIFDVLIENCKTIIELKKKGQDARRNIESVNNVVMNLYGIEEQDELELNTWFKRRYPHFGRGKAE